MGLLDDDRFLTVEMAVRQRDDFRVRVDRASARVDALEKELRAIRAQLSDAKEDAAIWQEATNQVAKLAVEFGDAIVAAGKDRCALRNAVHGKELAMKECAEAQAATVVLVSAACQTCHGTNRYTPHCYKCDDSGEDHDDCPGEEPCPRLPHSVGNLPDSVQRKIARDAALEAISAEIPHECLIPAARCPGCDRLSIAKAKRDAIDAALRTDGRPL